MLGQVIHGYRIDRALSVDKGGFGDVYFASHVDSGAEAVIKVLKPEMSAQRDIVARFFNEARAAASVHHPGIVQIHNVGYHGERAYLLMERLRGEDLETRVARGPLPIERAVIFMRQAAGAIGAAHERGIVHRDLKPANLFVVEDPDVVGGERVKVLDFGIAKLTADAGAGKTQGVFGTPAYMSPEQCASTGAVDARADLYSLGCIFYELVCGRPPFGQGGIELIAAQLRDTATPPRALAPWLPPRIEQVILRLLEKQPERRVASCTLLVAALDEATAASGMAGLSASQLRSGGGAAESMPPGRPDAGPASPTTLSSAARGTTGAVGGRGLGVWLAVGAVVVVGGAVAAMTTFGGRREPPTGSGDGSAVTAAPSDARPSPPVDPVAAVAPADAAATVTPDKAKTTATAPRASNKGSGSDATGANGDATSSKAIPRRPAERKQESPRASLQREGTSDKPAPVQEPKLTQAEIAARLNDEGKEAMFRDDYGAAAIKFQEAVARTPEAKYFINLCAARLQAGQFGDALVACQAVGLNHPTQVQQHRADLLIEKIRAEAKLQNIDLR
jgi:serine/threonine-protein kinase